MSEGLLIGEASGTSLLIGEAPEMSLLIGEASGMSVLIGEAPGMSLLSRIPSKAGAQLCTYDLYNSDLQPEKKQKLQHQEL